MPELPEVESIRRGIDRGVLGFRVAHVDVRRHDILEGTSAAGRSAAESLLLNDVIDRTERKGKQLAIISRRNAVVRVHLGMSGSLMVIDAPAAPWGTHTHIVWTLIQKACTRYLVFRDPRRFGSVRTMSGLAELRDAWNSLGPDALTISARVLRNALGERRTSIKAALLNQSLVAGVGNIYADESLFRSGIDPRRACAELSSGDIRDLAGAIRRVLREAVRRGGSSIRDYRDARGAAGSFQEFHQVYGRPGQPCLTCGRALAVICLAQRATVFCPTCQA